MATVILLMGPTGAGKTDVSLELARHLPLEIVSVDSAMVYRSMDIGTAKPSAQERARVPHHLIDILDPADSYSVGQFLRDARRLIDEITVRGRMPLLTGGTMLYFHALKNGLAELPESDPGVRAELDRRAEREGWAALHAELARLDPQAAGRIHPNDPQRIQRALEVCWLTGRPMSALQGERRSILQPHRTFEVVLCPTRRETLHERIEKRFHHMMAQGFLEEVRRLRERGDLHAELPALRAVGYRQLWGHLEGVYDLQEAMRLGVAATRQLAKRQLTWLRAIKEAQWMDPQESPVVGRILQGIPA